MQKKNFESKKLYSFDRSFSAEVLIKQPDKYREIEEFSKANEKIISTGANLSYSPLSFDKNNISILLKKFNRIIKFNPKKKEITVEAGMTFAELLNFTLKYNLWIPQIPGYPLITLGGAVATNAHGKSCAVDGTIRNSVKSILLYHKNNGWLNLSSEENHEIFELTLGGLGLTGTILNITFKLQEIKNLNFLTHKSKVNSLEECVERINKNSKMNNSYIYSWNMAGNIKDLGSGLIFENVPDASSKTEISIISDKRKLKSLRLPFTIWNKASIQIANYLFFVLNNRSKMKKNESFMSVFFPFYGKESYFFFFGKNGFLESQLLIPQDKVNEFFDEFRFQYKIYKPSITLLSFKNMKGSQDLLRFEDNKICLTIDYVNNDKSRKFMNEIDLLCEKYDILPSIIKDSRVTKTTFKKCYKNLDKFKNKLNEFDKKRAYSSSTTERLEI